MNKKTSKKKDYLQNVLKAKVETVDISKKYFRHIHLKL